MEPSFFDNAVFIAIIAAFASAVPAYLAYKRSKKTDAIAAQASIATVEQGTISQVIEGLNTLVTNLQNDNAVLRQTIQDLNAKVEEIIQRCEGLKAQLAELKSYVSDPSPE